ncbi:hypothetical protein OH809_40640 [Streptomyces sp. NBC_00873]|uniref:hypothetical protein n=1 Tax=unclassified Streptomyces TaxID=2593676 RepID=UPI00386C0E7B|nr:hypothetical protein OH809_40640 [Streptomyces sp. NBC_00873]WTA41765.1 hypothetical protein OH821_03060 [Streptomyces sp. NBC_00842]
MVTRAVTGTALGDQSGTHWLSCGEVCPGAGRSAQSRATAVRQPWTRVEKDGSALLRGSRLDGSALLRGSRLDAAPLLGAVALLSTDAWRVRAALESAARGGALEAFDALG